MEIPFVKYQGTGNDFVIIDQRISKYISIADKALVEKICDRHFGVGADGLMLIESSEISSFKMVYFNADGQQSTMCGNGGRCIGHYAMSLGIFEKEVEFEAIDGLHKLKIEDKNLDKVSLQMIDVMSPKQLENNVFELNTGSPHFIKFVDEIPIHIKNEGATIRYNETYKDEGINVNFVKISSDQVIQVATYERGVEDETLSCGTGVTAAAICVSKYAGFNSPIKIMTKGGQLSVSFQKNMNGYHEIWLTGPATHVFSGFYKL